MRHKKQGLLWCLADRLDCRCHCVPTAISIAGCLGSLSSARSTLLQPLQQVKCTPASTHRTLLLLGNSRPKTDNARIPNWFRSSVRAEVNSGTPATGCGNEITAQRLSGTHHFCTLLVNRGDQCLTHPLAAHRLDESMGKKYFYAQGKRTPHQSTIGRGARVHHRHHFSSAGMPINSRLIGIVIVGCQD